MHDAILLVIGKGHVRWRVFEGIYRVELAAEDRAVELEGFAAVAVEGEVRVERKRHNRETPWW